MRENAHHIAETGLYEYLVQQHTPGLDREVETITLNKGREVYPVTARYTPIYEIVSGGVKLGGVSEKGEEYIYELLTQGEFFGNLAVLGDTFREFCKTITATRLHVYRSEFFKHIMIHDPMVASWSITRIVARWNKTETMLANIRSYEPRERILQVYKDLQIRITTAGNREVWLNKLVTLKDIADLTATSRQLVASTIKQ